MLLRRAFLRLGIVIAVGGLMSGPALAAGADDFIRVTGQKAFTSLAGDISEQERIRRFRAILTDAFDLPTIARFVLGRYWRLASKEQRSEYIQLFEEFIVQAYSHRFKDLSGKEFRVQRIQQITRRDKLVLSEILLDSGRPPIRVNWRVRGPKSGYRVVDVTVEGVSMSITQRDEFAAVIRRSGGKVEGLLAALRSKTREAK